MIYKRYAQTPGQILYRAGETATPADYEALNSEVRKLSASTCHYIQHMLDQDPAVQLKINLRKTLDIAIGRRVMSVMPDGLTEREVQILYELTGLSSRAQLAGHELFNLRERQLLVDTFRAVFSAYRCRRNGQKEK